MGRVIAFALAAVLVLFSAWLLPPEAPGGPAPVAAADYGCVYVSDATFSDQACVFRQNLIIVEDRTCLTGYGAFMDYYVMGVSSAFRLRDDTCDGNSASFVTWSPTWKYRVCQRLAPPPSTSANCSDWSTNVPT